MGNDLGELTDRLPNLRPDLLFALVGVVLSLLLVPLRFFATEELVETVPIAMALGFGLYLFAATNSRSEMELPRLSPGFARAAPGVTMAVVGVMVLVARFAGSRTLTFLLLGGIATTFVLLQVVLVADEAFHPGWLLGQLVLLAITIRFAALATTPGFIGVDIWTHVTVYSQSIAQAGSLAPIADQKYYAAPLYHLLTVTAARFLGTSLRTGLYLSLGAITAVSLLFVYATARFFVEPRWAVFAAGLFAIADHAVRWSIHLIPTSMGLVLFLGIMIVLVRQLSTNEQSLSLVVVGVLLSIGVILTHQISAFIVSVLLLSVVVARLFARVVPYGPAGQVTSRWTGGPANLTWFAVFHTGIMIAVWSVTPWGPGTFLTRMFGNANWALTVSAGLLNLAGGSETAAVGGSTEVAARLAGYIDVLGFLFLLFLAVAGCLTAFSFTHSRSRRMSDTLVIAMAVMLVFALGLPLFGINAFLPGRWFAFLYAPMVVIGVLGIRRFTESLDHRTALAVVLVIALTYPSAMLVSDAGTRDNPVFEDHNVQYSYSQSELAALETINTYGDTGATVTTDHPYVSLAKVTMGGDAEMMTLDESGHPTGAEWILYRDYQSQGASQFTTADGTTVKRNFAQGTVCPDGMNHVYANGNVRLCTSRGDGQ